MCNAENPSTKAQVKMLISLQMKHHKASLVIKFIGKHFFPPSNHTVICCLPTHFRLHKIMPGHITDEECVMCGAIEIDEHFLWSCSIKRPI